jgi:hypothetical protein
MALLILPHNGRHMRLIIMVFLCLRRTYGALFLARGWDMTILEPARVCGSLKETTIPVDPTHDKIRVCTVSAVSITQL